jgi:hypothetical protein
MVLQVSAQNNESVLVNVVGLSPKNLDSFQAQADTWTGIHYLGFCVDMNVAQFMVDRRVVATDSSFANILRSAGYAQFNFKTPVPANLFMRECKQFEPRH